VLLLLLLFVPFVFHQSEKKIIQEFESVLLGRKQNSSRDVYFAFKKLPQHLLPINVVYGFILAEKVFNFLFVRNCQLALGT
jgi:hypothetical protein